jgi:antirestriction protein ArdC
LRTTLSVQQRVTASMQRSDGRTIHIRKSTRAEPSSMRIYQALGISPAPEEARNSSFDPKNRENSPAEN